jgi:hypothetical protein
MTDGTPGGDTESGNWFGSVTRLDIRLEAARQFLGAILQSFNTGQILVETDVILPLAARAAAQAATALWDALSRDATGAERAGTRADWLADMAVAAMAGLVAAQRDPLPQVGDDQRRETLSRLAGAAVRAARHLLTAIDWPLG